MENISTNVELNAKKSEVIDALKVGKLYLKGEYVKLCQICDIAALLNKVCC